MMKINDKIYNIFKMLGCGNFEANEFEIDIIKERDLLEIEYKNDLEKKDLIIRELQENISCYFEYAEIEHKEKINKELEYFNLTLEKIFEI